MSARRKSSAIKPAEPQYRVLATLSMCERIKEACTALDSAMVLAERAGLDKTAQFLAETCVRLEAARAQVDS